MKIYYSIVVILFLTMCFSCSKELLVEEFPNTPTGNYDALWNEYKRNYGAFEAKHINWDSLYPIYRAGMDDNSSELELYNAVTGLIKHLNDGHITLMATGFKLFYSCQNNCRPHFVDSKNYESINDIAVFNEARWKNYLVLNTSSNQYVYSYIKSNLTSKKIGYLYISSFLNNIYPTKIIDEAMVKFESADAIILDLRFNGGGANEPIFHLLSKFADKKRVLAKSKLRNGPNENDFTEIYKHNFSPKGKIFVPKPVIVLVNKFSASSSEYVFLGLRTLPYVTSVGDSTCGAISSVQNKLMPNGWQFRICPQVVLDSTGNYLKNTDGHYPDGYGFAPDIRVINTLAELNSGYDAVLAKAIDIVNHTPKSQ